MQLEHSWRNAILKEFIPKINKLTLVSDPDALLTEEKLSMELHQRGFDLIEFTDSITFRYAYESHYRSQWDMGKETDLVVILRMDENDFSTLPYDLLHAGKKLTFNLGDLFPNFSYAVLENLDTSLLDALFDAQEKAKPERMGDNSSKDFILRNVFGIAPELIFNDTDLLRTLLRLHYGNLPLPKILSLRLVEVLNQNYSFSSWPLASIIPDSEWFFSFLQERWPLFIKKRASLDEDEAADAHSHYNLHLFGPAILPFDHQDIKIYIDNLFLEGKLSPVAIDEVEIEENSWLNCGIVSKHSSLERSRGLLKLLKEAVPGEESRYGEWIPLSLKWAELSSIVHTERVEAITKEYESLWNSLNTNFYQWLHRHYGSLINLPPTKPVMVHHIPRYIAREGLSMGKRNIALIVVDGLSMDQWVTIRKVLKRKLSQILTRDSSVFSWVPTITSIARQAIFSGKAPLYFPNTLETTNSEEKLWKQFWSEQGIDRRDVGYLRNLGDGSPEVDLDKIIQPGKTKVLGLVVDKVDKIMHGMELGAAGMHNQIRQWSEYGYLATLIERLMAQDFHVWLTSDHGNIECRGKGNPKEGSIAKTRGERVRVYPTEELRDAVTANLDFATPWEPVGLPPTYFPLLASGNSAFTLPGTLRVGHGGASLEELMVPFIKFERTDTE